MININYKYLENDTTFEYYSWNVLKRVNLERSPDTQWMTRVGRKYLH